MNEKLTAKLASLRKQAEGQMPPGMMPPGGDPMAGGMAPMGPPPPPTAQEIMSMQDPAMMGGPPMDPMAGGMPPMDPMASGMPPMDPAMMGGVPPMDPAMMGGIPPMDPMAGMAPPAKSPEELAADLANAEALSAMANAVTSVTDVLAQNQASVADSIQNAASIAAASPIADEIMPEDIGPLMEGDAV